MNNLEQKRFPTGRFEAPENICDIQLTEYIKVIKNFPDQLKNLIENFNDDQLDTQYREGGWKVRQLVNHIADSHMKQSYSFKIGTYGRKSNDKTLRRSKICRTSGQCKYADKTCNENYKRDTSKMDCPTKSNDQQTV